MPSSRPYPVSSSTSRVDFADGQQTTRDECSEKPSLSNDSFFFPWAENALGFQAKHGDLLVAFAIP